MSKKDTRANIKVSESTAQEFRERAEVSGLTHEQLLQELLNQEMKRTVTVERGMSFSNVAKRLEKSKEGD
ncbi:MAG: hypothetical protein ACE14S_02300 [Candidatus Bathyarchaeia archaeon]